MRVLVIMDAVETVVPARDTSLALVTAAHERGHEVHHALATDVSFRDGALHVTSRPVTPDPGHRHGMTLGPAGLAALGTFDAVLIRTDPPFDHAYLTLTLLLEHAPPSTIVCNRPRGLRDANEHLYPLRFPALIPPTMVTADRDAIVDFAAHHHGAVAKPVDGHGGSGVVRLLPGDRNTRSLLDTLTDRGRRAVVVQAYLPQVEAGDKRILLLGGEPLGAILRVPSPDDFRATIARGEVRACELSDADRRIVDALRPALRRDGLWFVGIDVIDGRLTEVNVTSPTGLVQLAALTGTRPADTVIAALEGVVAAQRRAIGAPPRPLVRST